MERDVCARRLMVPVLMAAGLALSGCQSPAGTPGTPTITSGGPIPSAVGTPGASSGSTDAVSGAAASITGPTTAAEVRANVPEAARQHTPEGAAAFVRYYVDMINWVSSARKKGVLPALGDSKCVSCRSTDKDIDDLLRRNLRYQKPPLELVGVYPRALAEPDRQLVDAVVDDVKNLVVDSNGESVENLTGSRANYLFDLRWSESKWTVREIEVHLVSDPK